MRPVKRVSVQCNIVFVTILKYLTCNFNNLELVQFKVNQGQRSWCQLGYFLFDFYSPRHHSCHHF